MAELGVCEYAESEKSCCRRCDCEGRWAPTPADDCIIHWLLGMRGMVVAKGGYAVTWNNGAT